MQPFYGLNILAQVLGWIDLEWWAELYLSLKALEFFIAICFAPFAVPIFVWLAYRQKKRLDKMSDDIRRIK